MKTKNVGNKLGIAQSMGIDVACSLLLPYPCSLRDIDICIILSNALDNAIQAVKRLDAGMEKYIHVFRECSSCSSSEISVLRRKFCCSFLYDAALTTEIMLLCYGIVKSLIGLLYAWMPDFYYHTAKIQNKLKSPRRFIASSCQ